jgi:hypothetical protein
MEAVTDSTSAKGGLRWHWLWFVPLCLLVLLTTERHTVVFGFATLKLFWQRWTWGALISPSAAFCLVVVISSIIWPLYGLAAVAFLAVVKRWLWVIVMAVALGIILAFWIGKRIMGL